MPPKHKQFKKPPLIEVFCEFFFETAAGVEWDSFIVPTFYRKVRKDFPTRQRMSTVGFQLMMGVGVPPPQMQSVGPPTPRHRFISENGKTLVQLGDNLLVVNQLPPYYGWERFEPTVMQCFRLYTQLWKPEKVARAAVHYIDKVDIPSLDVGIEEYFNLYPTLPEHPGTPATNLALTYEVQGAVAGDILVGTMRQHPSANPEGMTFLFQSDYVATGGLPSDEKAVQSWLNKAHDFVFDVFLSTFTDKCYKLWEQ